VLGWPHAPAGARKDPVGSPVGNLAHDLWVGLRHEWAWTRPQLQAFAVDSRPEAEPSQAVDDLTVATGTRSPPSRPDRPQLREGATLPRPIGGTRKQRGERVAVDIWRGQLVMEPEEDDRATAAARDRAFPLQESGALQRRGVRANRIGMRSDDLRELRDRRRAVRR
jgi:hypothetical protein